MNAAAPIRQLAADLQAAGQVVRGHATGFVRAEMSYVEAHAKTPSVPIGVLHPSDTSVLLTGAEKRGTVTEGSGSPALAGVDLNRVVDSLTAQLLNAGVQAIVG